MRGQVPRLHALLSTERQDVDGRDKPDRDGQPAYGLCRNLPGM